MAAALSMKNSSSHPSDSTAEESIKHHVGVFKKLAQIPSVSSAQFALTTAERRKFMLHDVRKVNYSTVCRAN